MGNAGYNVISKIIRFTEHNQDDDIGGAQPSGTTLYDNVQTRIQSLKPTPALLEQGLEMKGLYNAMVRPGNMVIEYNDQLEVYLPVHSKFFGEKFRVIGFQEVSTHADESRNYILLNLKRVERSIQNAYQ